MSVSTTTWAPSSYQFRIAAFTGRKSPPAFLGMRVHKLGRQVRCSAGSSDNGNGNVTVQQTNSNFSGWSIENDGSQKPNESQPKVSWSGGIVGAGVAGIILVAGLTVAGFSISKSVSVLKPKMEPLTTHQEALLSFSDQNDYDSIEDDGNKEDNTMLEDRHLEGKTALQALPGKMLVPAVVDQAQGQAFAALQVLNVVEGDAQPGDICTRREYARWLVSASSALSRNCMSKVFPAMYIENATELAFDDITPEDPDFSSIQGLAEAGLIASKLSRYDMNPSDQEESSLNFCPERHLSRKDLVSWKMSLEKRLLPVADRKILQQYSGFIDIDKINEDAWPALIADLSAGEQGITALAFGYTRLFQPHKPVTKAQAAIALTTGEASEIVNEELARIEAESIAEKAVAAHNSLVNQVEKDINSNFEKVFLQELEKINAVEKMAEDAKQELERIKEERENENIRLMEERADVDSEMEVFSKLRHEVEEQLQSVMSNKVEILYEKERLKKLLSDVEIENQEIMKLHQELAVEREALSMARSWAENEAKRASEQAKVLEEARHHWKSRGIKVVVDSDLDRDANAGASWLSAESRFSIEGTKDRARNLVEKLKAATTGVTRKPRETIDRIIQKVLFLVSQLKEWAAKTVSKVNSSIQDIKNR